MSEINRLGARRPPKRIGAFVSQRALPGLAGDPDDVVAEVNHFGFAGWSFEQRFHRIRESGLIETAFGKPEALSSLKFDQLCVDGEPHDSSGLFAQDIMRGHDELTQRERLLLLIAFHATSLV